MVTFVNTLVCSMLCFSGSKGEGTKSQLSVFSVTSQSLLSGLPLLHINV